MDASRQILAIDQGTTSSRAIVFDAEGTTLALAQREFEQHYPRSGWVEHDPEDIWETTLEVSREALAAAGGAAAIGITNQRETTLVWERDTGRALHRAIVWQDRRTAERCARLRDADHEETFTARTGLLLDPYFSGTKIGWILDHVPGARDRARAGELAFGTVDSFLIWRLTGGAVHATDATNASRTLLFDIHRNDWDDELLDLLDVPRAMLPEVRDSAADYGTTAPGVFDTPLPIGGVAGDQQAATIGQACFEPGMVKSTYGTGCFAVMNTGAEAVRSRNRLLTTIAYRLDGRTTYALEGSIFVAGAAVQWLRDGLGVIDSAAQTEALGQSVPAGHGVYLVPAFTGLGAPHWDPHARGALFGLTRDTGPGHLARAALESVCLQTRDLLTAMARDAGAAVGTLRVDGGMTGNDWLLRTLAAIAETSVERPAVTETTALGAAYLAGLHCGLFPDIAHVAAQWRCDARFDDTMDPGALSALVRGWDSAVASTREHAARA